MKNLVFGVIFLSLICLSCNSNRKQSNNKTGISATDSIKSSTYDSQDKEEIQKLIRNVLNWSETDTTFHLLPCLTNSNDSLYVGFDLKQLNKNLRILNSTGFFANTFVDNYKQIILTLDKKIRNKDFNAWYVGELPTFKFANDVDPWSLCQDVPYDDPNPWDYLEVTIIKLDNKNGELNWKWGKLELNNSPDWKEFSYRFKVTKENGKWMISYMQGFDFNENIQKD